MNIWYGGGDPKLGRTARTESQSEEEARAYGKWVRERLIKATPGLGRLTSDIQDEFKSTGGLLRTLDGGFVRCHSKPAALNYKLQSGGAILMKKAAIIVRDVIRRKGLDGFLIGSIHDEGQLDVHPRDVKEVGETCVQAIKDAGMVLGCKVPFTGEWKSGANWAKCH